MRSQDTIVAVVTFQHGGTRQRRHDWQRMSRLKYNTGLSNLHVYYDWEWIINKYAFQYDARLLTVSRSSIHIWGLCLLRVSAFLGGGGVCSLREGSSQFRPHCEQTIKRENSTLPHTSYAGGNKLYKILICDMTQNFTAKKSFTRPRGKTAHRLQGSLTLYLDLQFIDLLSVPKF